MVRVRQSRCRRIVRHSRQTRGRDGEYEYWDRHDLRYVEWATTYGRGCSNDEVARDVRSENVAEVEEAGEVDHSGDHPKKRSQGGSHAKGLRLTSIGFGCD